MNYKPLIKYLDLFERNNYFGKWIIDNEHAGTNEEPKVAPHLSYVISLSMDGINFYSIIYVE